MITFSIETEAVRSYGHPCAKPTGTIAPERCGDKLKKRRRAALHLSGQFYRPGLDKFNRHSIAFTYRQIFIPVFILKL